MRVRCIGADSAGHGDWCHPIPVSLLRAGPQAPLSESSPLPVGITAAAAAAAAGPSATASSASGRRRTKKGGASNLNLMDSGSKPGGKGKFGAYLVMHTCSDLHSDALR